MENKGYINKASTHKEETNQREGLGRKVNRAKHKRKKQIILYSECEKKKKKNWTLGKHSSSCYYSISIIRLL